MIIKQMHKIPVRQWEKLMKVAVFFWIFFWRRDENEITLRDLATFFNMQKLVQFRFQNNFMTRGQKNIYTTECAKQKFIFVFIEH